jgi:hypothetical protein
MHEEYSKVTCRKHLLTWLLMAILGTKKMLSFSSLARCISYRKEAIADE